MGKLWDGKGIEWWHLLLIIGIVVYIFIVLRKPTLEEMKECEINTDCSYFSNCVGNPEGINSKYADYVPECDVLKISPTYEYGGVSCAATEENKGECRVKEEPISNIYKPEINLVMLDEKGTVFKKKGVVTMQATIDDTYTNITAMYYSIYLKSKRPGNISISSTNTNYTFRVASAMVCTTAPCIDDRFKETHSSISIEGGDQLNIEFLKPNVALEVQSSYTYLAQSATPSPTDVIRFPPFTETITFYIHQIKPCVSFMSTMTASAGYEAGYNDTVVNATVVDKEYCVSQSKLFIPARGMCTTADICTNDYQGTIVGSECTDIHEIVALEPILYLYPVKEQAVSVKVDADVIMSDPAYNEGWNVVAEPSGLIDGTYNYLFYEARLTEAVSSNIGWTVSQNDLSSWFDIHLKEYGLNEKEASKMKGFWIDYLNDFSSVEIRPYPQDYLSQQLPLTINPRPDSLLRVFFQFTEGNSELQEPIIEQFTRAGFTAVEWGGSVTK